MTVATEGATRRLMSGAGTPAAAPAARRLMPGWSRKIDTSAVIRVSQNLMWTQRYPASLHHVPRANTSPLTSDARAMGSTSQSPKTFIAR
ncbi:hypothetical protein [Streptomyces celluloflavus]|uniref:hypothetical protein n=1 Tax=Streptomyces celluloflavus TaxID=58344 RepID=UPI003657F4AB